MARVDPSLRTAVERASCLAFLCSGNMIRSAFAELYARHLGCPLPVRSGATSYQNDAILPATARALETRGVDPAWMRAFRPTTLETLVPQLDPNTIFLGMKHEHLAALPATPDYTARSFLLSQALGRTDEIADPMFEGGFDGVIATVAECVDALVEAVEHDRARGAS